MNRLLPKLKEHACEFALLGAMLAVAGYLMQRNFGLVPAIFADEWYYSMFSRLTSLREAIVPSYLYLWIFRSSNACGAQFLDCARGLNALFFVAAAPFVYLIARPLAGRPLALAVAVMGMLAPLNLYTTFFMPEAMYYFGFAVLSWVALTRTHWHSARHALATGALLGLMSLIKVHALFLLPALCLFIVFVRWSQPQHSGWRRDCLFAVGIAVLAMMATRLGLGYAFAGAPGLHLFGDFYSSSARSTANRSMLPLLAPAWISARAHLMAIVVLYVLPCAVLIHRMPLRPAQLKRDGMLAPVHLYALLMVGSAVAMTIAYTATLAEPGTSEGVRVHMRYYSFALPLLLVVAAASLGQPLERIRPKFGLAVAVLLAAVLLLALVKLPTYTLSMSDGPDIAAIKLRTLPGRAFVALNLMILALWALNKKLALRLYLFLAVPAALAAAALASTVYLQQLKTPWPADKAGEFARRNVPQPERKFITVAGTSLSMLRRAQFHIDDKDTALLELPAEHQPIESYQLPLHNKWLLVVGEHPLPSGIKATAATPDFALVRLAASRMLGTSDMVQPIGDALIERIDGLSYSEPHGRWSTAKLVVIHFRQPLPQRFKFAFKAQPFGPNADAPFILHAGGLALPFRLAPTGFQEIGLRVDSNETLRSLTIEVPHPVRPMDLGPSVDTRTIGLAISEISIGELEPAAPQSQAQR